jgi:hypothetical protein
MKVEGSITIDISENTQRNITKEYLRKKIGLLDPDAFIKDGKIYIATYHPAGSRLSDDFIKDATEEEILIKQVIDLL